MIIKFSKPMVNKLNHEPVNQSWKQHFPTYHFQERDIALEEYKVAAKSLESEERIFLNASNITLVSSAALGSIVVGYSEKLVSSFSDIIHSYVISAILLFLVSSFSVITLKYFADRQLSIVLATRKLIVLRRMLGLSYGNIQLLLPKSKVEGADEPFDIKLFPGWFSYVTYPFWMISIISSIVIFFLSAYFIKQNPSIVGHQAGIVLISLPALWFLMTCLFYRIFLLDDHENIRLIFFKFIFRNIGIPIFDNTEDVIYRARLAAFESQRLRIRFDRLSKFLVFIEDKSFYSHSGISYKSLLRGVLGVFGLKPRSGGSTIIQQLIRTLFIERMERTFRRKLVEIFLAPWMSAVFSKKEIIAIYLSSVRFERGCLGVISAMNHFFGRAIKEPSNAQCFFLIERVSNVRSKLLTNKVIETARNAQKNNLLSSADIEELIKIYSAAIQNKTIIASQHELLQLEEALSVKI